MSLNDLLTKCLNPIFQLIQISICTNVDVLNCHVQYADCLLKILFFVSDHNPNYLESCLMIF